MPCPYLVSRPMTTEHADGTETTIHVYGYVCAEPSVSPTVNACTEHLHHDAWGWT